MTVGNVRAVIAGTGMAVPDRRLTNAELEARVDTSDAWIVERTGIRERRVAGADDSTTSLAIAAGAAAIKDAGVTPDEIDLVLVATCTPDQQMPSTSAFVQDGLGLRGGALDVDAACAGFVYALVTAAAMVEAGRAGTVLVIGAETLSRVTDPDDRGTLVLFGDGAGACVIRAGSEADGGLLAFDLGCDGSVAHILEIPAGDRYIRMEGSEVFRRAVRVVVSSAEAALEGAGLTSSDVDLFVPHQANARILSAAGDRLRIPAHRTVLNLDRYGNTSAASIPIALAEAAERGRLHDGDVVLLSGFGAGMTWASAVLRWSEAA
ncbi:MAG: 3-oxoacyl-[acyl-carrier-protein] synthase [Actinomycetota bacterium]|nr:3-oxoacyl-[acyl-carrier-protein] synthase [Actinomycetota bacterium]